MTTIASGLRRSLPIEIVPKRLSNGRALLSRLWTGKMWRQFPALPGPLAVHTDLDVRIPQRLDEVDGCELASLVRVNDLRLAEPPHGLVQRLLEPKRKLDESQKTGLRGGHKEEIGDELALVFPLSEWW